MSSSGLIVLIMEVNYDLRKSLWKYDKECLYDFFDSMPSEKKLSNEKLECECMQFDICEYRPKKVGEVPFFLY